MDNKLKYFLYAAQYGSFAKTATHFYLSTTAISKAIAKLEAQVGFALFDRHQNAIELTQAGRDFYENAKYIAADYQRAIQAGQAFATHMQQHLAIGISSIYEAWLLAPLLNQFQTTHPKLRLTLTHRSLEQLAQDVANNDLDLAYSFAPVPPTANLVTTVLSRSRYLIAVATNSKLAAKSMITPSDLSNQVCGYYSQLTSLLAKYGLTTQAERTGVTFVGYQQYDTMELLLLAVACQQCFTFIPEVWQQRIIFPEISLRPSAPSFDDYQLVALRPTQSSTLAQSFHQLVQASQAD
ncbi:LysR family transcriptional regulator [Lacticaseibacillus paracasei]|uniref:LysR family transcriptional regulator n=1 Tax=Lacticaseibacillus paracasei TaxID=1597 RepID=UPI0023604EEA|nr:LysR family transcriptional regulator [Lacticaseibacillus paracasei]